MSAYGLRGGALSKHRPLGRDLIKFWLLCLFVTRDQTPGKIMSLHFSSKKLQPKGAVQITKQDRTISFQVRETPVRKAFLNSLTKRIWPAVAESLKLENLPFIVLSVLAAVSLISRIWLMRH
jgi:hypothetical protein